MIVIDVGNTSTAVGLWSNGRVCFVSHHDDGFVQASKAAEQLVARAYKPVGRLVARARRERHLTETIAYVSVVPSIDAKWRAWAKRLNLAFHQVSYHDFEGKNALDIRLDYPKPETIGADRLCDAVGAVKRYGAPAIVMDFGTALTAAVITADKVWRGGVIAPGFPLMRDYLFERTAKLPKMRLGSGKAPKIGRSTEEAMRFGALVGYRGMVREIVGELKRNFKADFKLVATGGFAKWVLKDINMDFTIDPSLTLYGAGLIGMKGDMK